MKDTSPFISSVARREIHAHDRPLIRLLWIQAVLLLIQTIIIILLVVR